MKPFALSEAPISYQLTIHFTNLFTYFHPENEAIRLPKHKNMAFKSNEILKYTRFMCENSHEVPYILETKAHFSITYLRIAQIIDYYGADVVKNWVTAIYGEKVA